MGDGARQRARAEDRIRAARATGLCNLLLHDAAQNQIWLEIIQIALDLLAWMPMLALTGPTRLWEVKRLRLRLFSAAAQVEAGDGLNLGGPSSTRGVTASTRRRSWVTPPSGAW